MGNTLSTRGTLLGMSSDLATPTRVGPLLRDWRRRRRLSQLDLALEAGISARHVSFVETGRAKPSREMVLHLADQLEVPLRERNRLLLAAGSAPVYGERSLDDPEMAPVRAALDLVLRGHEPHPAAVVDRTWELIQGNRGVGLLLEGVDPELLAPPVNVLRVSLHPDGMASRILNLADWRVHLLERLDRQIAATGDASLQTLRAELDGYPAPTPDAPPENLGDICIPLRLRTSHGDLSFISTIATFGTAVDITVAELAIESFFPADAATAEVVRAYGSAIDRSA
jgi:transcriptional regulator with XRE-family HTH domain